MFIFQIRFGIPKFISRSVLITLGCPTMKSMMNSKQGGHKKEMCTIVQFTQPYYYICQIIVCARHSKYLKLREWKIQLLGPQFLIFFKSVTM